MTTLLLPIASIALFVASVFVLAMVKRERNNQRRRTPKVEREKGLVDLLLLAEEQLSSLKPETEADDARGKRLRRDRKWKMGI